MDNRLVAVLVGIWAVTAAATVVALRRRSAQVKRVAALTLAALLIAAVWMLVHETERVAVEASPGRDGLGERQKAVDFDVAMWTVGTLSRKGIKVILNDDFPGTVAILRSGKQRCGGYLFDPATVITAAHCLRTGDGLVTDIPESELSVTYGLAFQRPLYGPVPVLKTIVHNEFGAGPNGTLLHDIAVVRLAQRIPAVAVPFISDAITPPGTEVRIAGWGIDENDEPLPELHCVSMSVTKSCGKLPVSSGQLCVVDPLDGSKGQSLCKGDSGSPAYLSDGSIVAIVSASVPGCKKTQSTHDLVTRLGHYTDFITTTMLDLPRPPAENTALINVAQQSSLSGTNNLRAPTQCRANAARLDRLLGYQE